MTRFNAGSYVDGVWTPAATPSTSVTVNGNIQAEMGRDKSLMNQSSGQYQDDFLVLRTNEEVLTSDKSGAKKADRLTYQGFTYECIAANYRGTLSGLEHWVSTFEIIDPNAESGAL